MRSQEDTKAHLFLDNTWIEDSYWTHRVFHHPEKYPDPILKPDRPWEYNLVAAFGTILKVDEQFKMWYMAMTGDRKWKVCYAQSIDGIHWEKPELGVNKFNGDLKSNIVLTSSHKNGYIDDISIIYDPVDTSYPYKALFWDSEGYLPGTHPNPNKQGIHLAESKDGIRWRRHGRVLKRWGDRFNVLSRKLKNRIVLFGREPYTAKKYNKCRVVSMIESRDFLNWSEPKLILTKNLEDPLHSEAYSAMAFQYEDRFIGTLDLATLSPDDAMDNILIWSQDLQTWSRSTKHKVFIERNPSKSFDSNWINLPSNPPIENNNRLWFYYSGRSYSHSPKYPMNHGAIGLAILRIDGFCSIFAEEQKGWLLTKTLTLPKTSPIELYVNADCRRHTSAHPHFCSGELRVEIRSQNNQVIKGFELENCIPIQQNTVDLPKACSKISWKNKSFNSLKQKRIKLYFEFRDAHLYSFRFLPSNA